MIAWQFWRSKPQNPKLQKSENPRKRKNPEHRKEGSTKKYSLNTSIGQIIAMAGFEIALKKSLPFDKRKNP